VSVLRRKGQRVEGRKPSGFHENEKGILAQMRALHRKPAKGPRLSYDAIAQHLNEKGITTRYGKTGPAPPFTCCYRADPATAPRSVRPALLAFRSFWHSLPACER
jgi:hypothetical protein